MKYSGNKTESSALLSSGDLINSHAHDLEAILNSTNARIWTIDKDYYLRYGNISYYEECRIGFNKTVNIGDNVLFDDLDEKVKIEFQSYYDRALRGEKFSIERKRKYSRETKWSIYHFGPLYNDNKECIGASVVAHDITDRVTATEALKSSTKRFEEMVEMLPEAIFETNTDLKLTYVNQRAMDMFGYSTSDVIHGLNGLEMIAEEFREIAKQNLVDRTKGEHPEMMEYKGLKKDGTVFPILFHANSVFENGEFKGVRGVIVDITKQKREEEKQKQLVLMLDLAPSSIIVHDFYGNFLYVNQKTFDLHGYHKDEFLALSLDKIISPESSQAIHSRMNMIRENGEANFHAEHIKKDGSKLLMEIFALITEWDGQHAILSVGTDITKRKLDEQALIESETKFKTISENSPDAIFLVEEDGRYVYANQSASDLLGYSVEELLTLNIKDIGDQGITGQRFRKLLTDGKFYSEIRLRKKDGSYVDVDLNAIVLPNGFIYGSCRDLTERKKAEEKIKQSETFLKETQKIANLGSYKLNMITGNWECSNIMDNIFGIDENYDKTVAGWMSIVHPDWRESMNEYLIDEIFNKKSNFNREYKIIRKNDNEERWVHGLGRLEFDSSGNPVQMIGTIQDITDIKKIQEEITYSKTRAEEAEIQLLSILENSPTGFAINSISTGKVRYVNKAFSEIYHIPYDLCQNVDSFIDYVYGNQMALGQKILADVASGDPKRMKWDMIPVTDKSTKKTHYVSASNIIIKDLDLMISSAWDVTSQVENEEILISTLNKATESDRLKTAFLANMSHEIRTPMNGILGFASLLKEPKLTGEEQKKYIEIIEKSGERMLNTINDIIDISKIESGQIEIMMSELNINELFENTIAFFSPQADKKGIELRSVNKLTDNDIIIDSDKEKIEAILTNLVKNALKFCDKGFIELGCSRKDELLAFYVKDTGKGIPADRLDAIFERFIQADIDDRDVKEGSGLGLAIAKSYAELLGGKIWVESTKDIGSTFFFTIPFKQKKSLSENTYSSKENIEDKISGLNVLIVEDDQVSELLTKLMIEKISNKVIIARTGAEAVEICMNNKDIDLILMDIKMPVLDGYNATRKIREFNRDVIIIAVTAFALTGDREKAIDAGCNDYLTKPLSQNGLNELLKLYF